MNTGLDSADAAADRRWYIVGRWQEYEGEGRANLLRIVGVSAFYLVELANYYGLHLGFLEIPPTVERPAHLAITALALCWAIVAGAVLMCRQLRFFPAALKVISTGCDILLLTAVLTVADGPRSPLIVGYFLILTLAALRFSLALVWFATAGTAAAYLFLLGYARWFADRDLRVPRYQQLIFLLAVVLTGVILGQVIRRVRRLADAYARAIGGARPGPRAS
jgi:hypothetical protein